MSLALSVRILRRALDGRATFRRGEASRRAIALSRAWDEHWAEAPYDGGADVILPTRAERDALARRHRRWRSTRRDGL